ncbi:MAG: hypothetical protein IKB12_07420 [Clostridia bacterium]|nr:hypothetical protein [Clostridia bacterium]
MKKHLQNAVIFLLVILIIIMTAFVSLLCYVCFFYEKTGNMETELIKQEYMEYTEYDPTEINIKPLGRTSYSGGKRYISMSGAGIEFFCKGDYVTFDLYGVFSEYQTSAQKARVGVYLDGVLVLDEIVDYEKVKHRLDISAYTKGVTVRIMKLSEAQFSSVAIGKIGVYSAYNIAPTPEKRLKIEFIGDSITCGYGLDESPEYYYFTTLTENFSKTYAFFTAEHFGADFSAVAFSGYGVYSGFTQGGRNSEDVISRHYLKSALVPYEEHLWDFSKTENNLVVINLGTNDASYCSKSYTGRQNFTSAYVELLKTVREKNPTAYILCILGDMNNSLYPCIEEAVRLYSNEMWDSAVSAATVTFDMGNTDIVVDGHPGVLANKRAASDLTEIITKLINEDKIIIN